MRSESEPFESFFASGSLAGMIRSSFRLLRARRVRGRGAPRRLSLADIRDLALYTAVFPFFGSLLHLYQQVHYLLTGKPRSHPEGSWQYYLISTLRADTAHHTNETVGYHQQRPTQATPLDDLTAWVMTVMQFVWSYDTLMGAIWDEWTLLKLVGEAAVEAELGSQPLFQRLQRQWELARPYNAPLNGTYADVRRAGFDAFLQPRLEMLPADLRSRILAEHERRAEQERVRFQRQMSVLASVTPGRFSDHKEPLELWQARIAIVHGGRYYLVNVAAHDSSGRPLMFGPGGYRHPLMVVDGKLYTLDGERLHAQGDQVFRVTDGQWIGYLDMASVASVKLQLQHILLQEHQETWQDDRAVDILLAETPRRHQVRLRRSLPEGTRRALDALRKAAVIVNWDALPRDRTLAELRRVRRGIGDHALTLMRTETSILFDQSHIFFDGTWSLAMAEVLTSAAVQWCRRCISIPPIADDLRPEPLRLESTPLFLREASVRRQLPEISAETTIYDISQIFKLREMLISEYGTSLTVNDLLVTTRIFHAAHYEPSTAAKEALAELAASSRDNRTEQRMVQAIRRSLARGRRLNPALLIPVDASPIAPHERIFPLTFRNFSEPLVWIWDDTWEAYQAYRRHDPPNTPAGYLAYDHFVARREALVDQLHEFSNILDASKAVALRGESVNIAILKLLPYLPEFIQHSIKGIAEVFPLVNEIARGDEVYSNVGRVAADSSLTRFMSAKDDGNTKALVWGIMTDNAGRMIVTMRDFRPHVRPLLEAGRKDLAQMLAQDYVVSYTADLIGLVARLWAMLQAGDPRRMAPN